MNPTDHTLRSRHPLPTAFTASTPSNSDDVQKLNQVQQETRALANLLLSKPHTCDLGQRLAALNTRIEQRLGQSEGLDSQHYRQQLNSLEQEFLTRIRTSP